MTPEEENMQLREALGFYADRDSWRSSTVYMCGHSGKTRIDFDGGNRARALLSALKSKEGEANG